MSSVFLQCDAVRCDLKPGLLHDKTADFHAVMMLVSVHKTIGQRALSQARWPSARLLTYLHVDVGFTN